MRIQCFQSSKMIQVWVSQFKKQYGISEVGIVEHEMALK